MTRPAAEVILRPLISEKVYETSEKREKKVYGFRVARDANKQTIKEAIEALYGVRVVDVNTMWRRGKKRRSRVKYIHKPDWKRALVTLAPGDVIELI